MAGPGPLSQPARVVAPGRDNAPTLLSRARSGLVRSSENDGLAMIGAARMNDAWDAFPAAAKAAVDLLAVTAWLGVLLRLLPHISTILTVIWMAIRIYESATVQRLLGRRHGVTAGKEQSNHDETD